MDENTIKEQEAANILLQLFLVSKYQNVNPAPKNSSEKFACCIKSCSNKAHNRNVGSLKYYHECNRNHLKRGYTKICDSCYQEDYNMHKKRRKNSPKDTAALMKQLETKISQKESKDPGIRVQNPGNKLMIAPLRELGATPLTHNTIEERAAIKSTVRGGQFSFPLSHIQINE